MFILEERCVPKCSSVVSAAKFVQTALQEQGSIEKQQKNPQNPVLYITGYFLWK